MTSDKLVRWNGTSLSSSRSGLASREWVPCFSCSCRCHSSIGSAFCLLQVTELLRNANWVSGRRRFWNHGRVVGLQNGKDSWEVDSQIPAIKQSTQTHTAWWIAYMHTLEVTWWPYSSIGTLKWLNKILELWVRFLIIMMTMTMMMMQVDSIQI